MDVAIHPAGQAQAQGARVEFVGLALAVERNGGDEKTLRARRDEIAMEHEAEAARLLDGVNHQPRGDPFLHLGDELIGRELARSQRRGVVALGHGHDELQMHVQPQLERGPVGIQHGFGQRLRRGQSRLGRGRRGGCGHRRGGGRGRERVERVNSRIAFGGRICFCAHVMNGFEVAVCFHYDLECGPVGPARSNPSWHLTRRCRSRCNPTPSWAGSLRWGR